MGDEWYAPTRGLTVPLRTSYAQEVSELAVKAERDHGVPAPILAAMAVDQSGYGTIRVALAANIIFSFKWISATQAGGRSACTPQLPAAGRQGKNQHRLQGSCRL